MPWFTTKKVEGSATLAEKLAETRAAHNVDMDQLSAKTKITKKYIVYLEEGKLDKLPAEIYVKGFLKKIAEFYKIECATFLRLYEKEDIIRRNIDKSKYPSLNLYKSPTFIVTPRTITVALAAIVAVLFLIFLFYQLNFALSGPELIIESPQDDLVTDKTPLLVSGTVKDPDAAVSVNGEAINLRDGRIAELVNLNPGLNMIKISATNKFRKTSAVIKKVILRTEEAR